MFSRVGRRKRRKKLKKSKKRASVLKEKAQPRSPLPKMKKAIKKPVLKKSRSSRAKKASLGRRLRSKLRPAFERISKRKKTSSKVSSGRIHFSQQNILLDSVSALVSEEKFAFSGEKFRLGEVKERKTVKIKLPLRYFDNKIVLMVRDPWWLYTYWDISPEREKNVLKEIPLALRKDCKKIIRIYKIENQHSSREDLGKDFFDIEIEDIHFGNWYINVNKPESNFCVEIGYLTREGRFYPLARSNSVFTPYFGLSPAIDEEWIMPEEEYLKILGLYNLGRSSWEIAGKIEEIFKRQISSFPSSFPSSFQLMGKEKEKFFFELSTELIIYGRTEPDAKLSLRNKKVPLAKDGTFRLRFLLPLGKFTFPFEAVSSSGKNKIRISPQVERSIV